MQNENYDVVVIGGGPGGYSAAIKAAQLGKKTALIEKDNLGGTCLNVGCIPTKILIANAKKYANVKDLINQNIISANLNSLNYSKIKEKKDFTISKMRKGIEGLLQSNKVTLIRGKGKIISNNSISIDNEKTIFADNIIIATGSQSLSLPHIKIDKKLIHNSSSILEIETLPKSIIIVGGGYIGCEFATIFNLLDVKVTIVEALDSILQAQGNNISTAITKAFKTKGIDLLTKTKVISHTPSLNSVTVNLDNNSSISADMLLIVTGRKPNINNIDESINIETENNAIKTNEKMQTNIPNIYAIGDVNGKWMLAHTASHEAIVAAYNACGIEKFMSYNEIPSVVFTNPEIATVGLLPEQALDNNYDIIIGNYPYLALGKALADSKTEGFAQIIAEKKSKKILGAQVIGNEASSIISEMTLAISKNMTLEDIFDTIHPHPTTSEIWLEAAAIAMDQPLNYPPKIKR